MAQDSDLILTDNTNDLVLTDSSKDLVFELEEIGSVLEFDLESELVG